MNRVLLFFVALLMIFGGGMAIRMGYLRSLEPALEIKDAKEVRDTSYLKVGTDQKGKGERIPGILHDFELVERTGQNFASKDLLGDVWVASFFFATCQHSCKQQNEHVSRLHSAFKDKGVKFLSITVDPEKDSPDRLSKYASEFTTDADNWLFLTGNLDYIRRIGVERFRLPVAKQTHLDVLVPVDKWGNLRGRYHWKDELEARQLKRKLDELLAEEEEPQEYIDQKKQEEEQARQMIEQQKARDEEAKRKNKESKEKALREKAKRAGNSDSPENKSKE